MKRDTVFEDKRLLEAIDHIDRKYISEALEYYDEVLPVGGSPERDKRATRRSIKYALALAACLVLFSAVIPVVGYVMGRLGALTPGGTPVGGDSESETAGEVIESNSITEPDPYVETTEMFGEIYPVVEDTWHLSEWKYIPIKAFWYYEPIDFSPEAMKTYVKLPLEYEETVDGMTIKVEFFQDTYPIFSYIQARITYVNNTGSNLRFQNADLHTAGYFAAGGELYCGCYESPDFDFITHADSTTLVENGQSHVVEVIYLFTNSFDPSKTDHTYHIDACFYVPDSGIPPEVMTFSISFPIEVLKHE